MNTNPKAKRILCFGDSNTWGYIPGTAHQRYPSNVRWTGILQDELGSDFEVIEEGLNSRGIIKGDSRPGKEGRSAMEYIFPCLDSHDPLDYMVICLGANELKAEFNLSAKEVGENLRTLVTAVQTRPSQGSDLKPKVVIVVPALIDEETEYAKKANKFIGASIKSVELRDVLKAIATETDSLFVDVQNELKTGSDGVHLLEESHMALGKAVASILNR